MGLDMYLTKRTYVKRWSHQKTENKYYVSVKKGKSTVKHIQPKRVSEIIEEIAYWRKANQIHIWFVKNVQGGEDNCEEHYVTLDKLRELKSICEQVLKNNELAEELLPTQSGFFFGGTEYDEYYFKDLEYTVKMIDEVIEENENFDSLSDFYYRSSW